MGHRDRPGDPEPVGDVGLPEVVDEHETGHDALPIGEVGSIRRNRRELGEEAIRPRLPVVTRRRSRRARAAATASGRQEGRSGRSIAPRPGSIGPAPTTQRTAGRRLEIPMATPGTVGLGREQALSSSPWVTPNGASRSAVGISRSREVRSERSQRSTVKCGASR
jgi:hypothetical protein